VIIGRGRAAKVIHLDRYRGSPPDSHESDSDASTSD
jgi:hypothetical protein